MKKQTKLNYVKFEMKCPECNVLLKDFLTDNASGVLQCNSIDLWKVFNFYTLCPNCDTWIEFNRKPQNITIEDFEMTQMKRTWDLFK